MPPETEVNPSVPETPEDSDPHATKEADEIAQTPDVEVKPEDVKDLSEKEPEHLEGETEEPAEDPAPADEPKEESKSETPPLDPATPTDPVEPAPAEVQPALEDPAPDEDPKPTGAVEDDHSIGADTDSDAPVDTDEEKPESSPESPVEPAKEAEPVRCFDGLHDHAKPLEKVLSEEVIKDLEEAAVCLFAARQAFADADLDGLDPELSAIVSNVRNQSAGILAALEGLYKRVC